MAKEELGPHGFINRKLSLAELMHLRGLLTELLRRVRNADDPTFSSFTQHSAHPMESFDGWLAEVSDFELLLDPLAVSRCKFVSALKENPVVDGIQTHMDVVSIADPFAESLSSSLVRSYRLQETGTADDGTSYARYKLESDHSEAQRIEVISGIGSWLSWVEMQVSLLETSKPEVPKGKKQSGGRPPKWPDETLILLYDRWQEFLQVYKDCPPTLEGIRSRSTEHFLDWGGERFDDFPGSVKDIEAMILSHSRRLKDVGKQTGKKR